jgi:selenocysteine lyase/cysteine desulfurase
VAQRPLADYRDEFDVVRRSAYLISASLGPVGVRSRRLLEAYMDAWAAKGAPDLVWFEDIFPMMRRLKDGFAALAGCDADEVAITTNTSIALATVLSCLDLTARRNRIVVSEHDFPSDTNVIHAWAARSGGEVVTVQADGLTIDPEAWDRAIDERTALVVVNRVLYRTSALIDAKAVCSTARERGALSMVDDYHGIGVVPVDLHDLGCDLYAAGVLKFMLGGPGCVLLYARRDRLPDLTPAVTGWFATAEPFSFSTGRVPLHASARRLEHGTPPAPVFPIAAGGLEVITEVGVERIRARQWELQDRVIAGADELGLEVRTPRARRERGGVVNVRVGDDAETICHRLLERGVCTDHRGDGLRISPHFFTLEDDVDRLFTELAPMLVGRARPR